MSTLIDLDPWQGLRRFTPARIALGRAGESIPTAALLQFGLAHAQARDAVRDALDAPAIQEQLTAAGYDSICVQSAATDRGQYLRRPDAGRQLNEDGRARLRADAAAAPTGIAIVIADGLSAKAAVRHAVPLLRALQPTLASWRLAPIVIAQHARVALGDEIGELLHVEQVAVLIGERPGLSSPDGLSVYLTYAPRIGRTDAERNCISNIRPAGLSYEAAAQRLASLLRAARRLGCSGVALNDPNDPRQLSNARA